MKCIPLPISQEVVIHGADRLILFHIELSRLVHLLQVVALAEFFGRKLGESLNLIVLKKEVAVRAQDVVAQQIRVMCGCENLNAWNCNQFSLDGFGNLEIIERIHPVHKDKRCVVQSEAVVIEFGKRHGSARRNAEKIRLLITHKAENGLPSIYRPRAQSVIQAILVQESLKITDFARLDYSLRSFGVTPAIRRTDIHHALCVIQELADKMVLHGIRKV